MSKSIPISRFQSDWLEADRRAQWELEQAFARARKHGLRRIWVNGVRIEVPDPVVSATRRAWRGHVSEAKDGLTRRHRLSRRALGVRRPPMGRFRRLWLRFRWSCRRWVKPSRSAWVLAYADSRMKQAIRQMRIGASDSRRQN